MLYIKNPGEALSLADIERFELKHDVRLTDDHRAFLLAFNGGAPYPNAFRTASGVEVVISRILSLYYHPLGSLDGACSESEWKQALKQGIVRVADDLAGQPIVMLTKGEDQGAVYILIDGQLYLIAASFTDLLHKAAQMEGIKPSSFHEELIRLAAEKVANGKAGVFEISGQH